jgi:PDZ domain-containing protein
VLILASSLLRVPYVIMSPGPVFNTIGDYQGKPVIKISGTRTYATKGNLDMTTVSERGGSSGGVSTAEVLLAMVRDSQVVVPRDALYPPDESGEQLRAANSASFATSQSDAVGAALGELGIPAKESVVVKLVGGGSPADGVIEAGDIITAINGRDVAVPQDVVDAVRAGKVGDAVKVSVLRAGADGKRTPKELVVTAGANPDPAKAGAPYLGISVATLYDAPFKIDFTLDSIGGPSAGLMFSLAIIDKLTPRSMTGGQQVAGTGTISPDGAVGPIGGIRHKMRGASSAGARLFLAPESNCDEVLGHVPDGLTVVPVGSLSQAREVVTDWVADPNAPLPTCKHG